MRIVIVGRGVIGSLYGYLWRQAGHSVTHWIKPKRWEAAQQPLALDILDQGRGRIQATYLAELLSETRQLKDADWIVVSVRHRDSLGAIAELANLLEQDAQVSQPSLEPRPRFLCFGNQWHGLNPFHDLLPKHRLFFGMPRGGGAILHSSLRGAIYREVILEKRDNPAEAQALVDLFASTHRQPLWVKDMPSWYRAHFATTCAWICGGTQARGFTAFSLSPRAIRDALLAGRECLRIAQAYGANLEACEDVRPFQAPLYLGVLFTWLALRSSMAQRISAGHGDYAPDEMAAIYEDVVSAGREFAIPSPRLHAYRSHFIAMLAAKA